MAFFDENIITIFAVLTIISNVIILLFVLDFLILKNSKKKLLGDFWEHIGKKRVLYSFVVALVAMGGSLTFSEILNFTPCKLCWFQRIFMYPISFLSGLALYLKDKKIMNYILLLAIIGLPIAGLHYFGQTSESTSLPCDAIGYSASCSASFFMEFGYITIPFMALSAFILIIIFWYLGREYN